MELFDKPLSKFTGAPVKKGTGHLSEANLLILPRRGSISSMAFEEGWVRSRIVNCRFRLPPQRNWRLTTYVFSRQRLSPATRNRPAEAPARVTRRMEAQAQRAESGRWQD